MRCGLCVLSCRRSRSNAIGQDKRIHRVRRFDARAFSLVDRYRTNYDPSLRGRPSSANGRLTLDQNYSENTYAYKDRDNLRIVFFFFETYFPYHFPTNIWAVTDILTLRLCSVSICGISS